MVELARNYGQAPLQLRQLARRQMLSGKYLEQLIATLKGAGLVKAVRGCRGGYTLAKPPGKITLVEIFRALEGSMDLVPCVGASSRCPRQDFCETIGLWSELTDALVGVLEATTLAQLVRRSERKRVRAGLA